VLGAVRWRHWVSEELQEVRVIYNERAVLETVVEETCIDTRRQKLQTRSINVFE